MSVTGAEELGEEILQKKAQSRVGATLRDKWHLDSLLGVGGMGAVYAATHRNGMRGAVKLLHPERAIDEQFPASPDENSGRLRRALVTEARSTAAIHRVLMS